MYQHFTEGGHTVTGMILKVKKKAKFRNRFVQMPHLTPDTIWESDNLKT